MSPQESSHQSDNPQVSTRPTEAPEPKRKLTMWPETVQSGVAKRVAFALGEGRTIQSVCDQYGVHRTQVARWRKGQWKFRKWIEDARKAVQEQVFNEGLALKANRVAHLQSTHDRLEQVREERAKDAIENPNSAVKGVPGAETGYIIARPKAQGRIEYAVDRALVELQAACKESIAMEVGDRNKETNEGGKVTVEINYVDVRSASDGNSKACRNDAVVDVSATEIESGTGE